MKPKGGFVGLLKNEFDFGYDSDNKYEKKGCT